MSFHHFLSTVFHYRNVKNIFTKHISNFILKLHFCLKRFLKDSNALVWSELMHFTEKHSVLVEPRWISLPDAEVKQLSWNYLSSPNCRSSVLKSGGKWSIKNGFSMHNSPIMIPRHHNLTYNYLLTTHTLQKKLVKCLCSRNPEINNLTEGFSHLLAEMKTQW